MTILLLVVPTAAFAQGTIEGNVRDVESGQGLVNARVGIPALELVDYTAATGAFSISGVAAGTHTLEIRLLGFGLHTQEVTVAAGQTLNLDIQLGVAVLALDELIVVGSRHPPPHRDRVDGPGGRDPGFGHRQAGDRQPAGSTPDGCPVLQRQRPADQRCFDGRPGRRCCATWLPTTRWF